MPVGASGLEAPTRQTDTRVQQSPGEVIADKR